MRAGKGGRCGRYGDVALQEGIAGIGWPELGDLSDLTSHEQLKERFLAIYPGDSPARIGACVGQVWAFYALIGPGDFIVTSISRRSVIPIGRVIGDYEYRRDLPNVLQHARRVEWLVPDMPRSAFDQDLQPWLSRRPTVVQIRLANAEERIRALVSEE